MKILLAGPGTGKTSKIKNLIGEQFPNAEKIKIISFTNATVNDLNESFSQHKNVSCSTLHSFALALNHLPDMRILVAEEEAAIESLSNSVGIGFNDLCQLLKCITFDGMIKQCVSFIKANPEYAKDKVGKLDLLVIDEFQDFNPDEQQLVKLISALSEETIIMGDDDQSIYGFKDADPDGIITLYKDDTIEKIAHENICYRCPDTVVEHCTKLLTKNKNRIVKEWKVSKKSGDVVFKQFIEQEKCDEYIIKEILEIRKIDKDASILVLSPVGFAADSLKELMVKKQVDFHDCWSRPIDKDILSKIWWINAFYNENKLPFIIFLLKHYNLLSKAKIRTLLEKSLRGNLDEKELIKNILALNYLPEQYSKFVLNPPTVDDLFQNHKEFDFAIEQIDIENFQSSISNLATALKPKKEFEKGKTNLMSIHKSKGLQAEYVFINGLVTGIIPNQARGLDSIEAQRRLLFVGMTRATKQLHLISTVEWDGKNVHKVDKEQFEFNFWKRKYRGKTSAFIEEIQSKDT